MLIKKIKWLLVFCLIVLSSRFVYAAKPYTAPELEVDTWINGEGTTMSALKGKVVVIDFFQLWCSGCNTFSIPLIKTWEEKFKFDVSAGNLVFLSIHSVFEGHDYQNLERLKAFVKEKGITHLVGNDKHVNGEHIPVTMKRYHTRGTPEVAIIDRQGIVRFQHFGQFNTDKATSFINELLTQP